MKFKINDHEWEIKEISNADMNIMCGSDKIETFAHGSTNYADMIIYINEDTKNKKTTLYHELCHCFMYEFGHNQQHKEFNYEDVCEICASSHEILHKIVESYFGIDKK